MRYSQSLAGARSTSCCGGPSCLRACSISRPISTSEDFTVLAGPGMATEAVSTPFGADLLGAGLGSACLPGADIGSCGRNQACAAGFPDRYSASGHWRASHAAISPAITTRLGNVAYQACPSFMSCPISAAQSHKASRLQPPTEPEDWLHPQIFLRQAHGLPLPSRVSPDRTRPSLQPGKKSCANNVAATSWFDCYPQPVTYCSSRSPRCH